MPEPLTSQLVADELKRLLAAFPRNLGAQNPAMMAEVYKSGLRGIDGEALRHAVETCIQNDSFFPKVARLREAASEWRRRNRPQADPRIERAWHTCPVCGATAKSRMIVRPVLVKPDPDRAQTWYQATEDGKPVFETVPSSGLYMDHLPQAHHVRDETESEYEGAA